MNIGIKVRGAHASKVAMRGAAVDLEGARKIKVGPAPYTDPTGLYCAYLNDSGTGVESIDDSSDAQSDCGSNGGYWISGSYGGGSWVNINVNAGTVTGLGYDSNGNPEVSIAGAMGSNSWGAWSQNFGSPGVDSTGFQSSPQANSAANNGPTSTTRQVQPKSPARQQCERNAQNTFNDAVGDTIWNNISVPFKAAGGGAVSGGIIGCVLTVEGGCFEGAIPGALTGLFGGALEGTIQAVSSDISGYRQANRQLAAALAASQQIP